MSRKIESIASVQFQVNTHQANGAMQALQQAAQNLAQKMDDVNRKIAALGEGAVKENPEFVKLQDQLDGYDKRLRDVKKAQRDFLRGAKAADQLMKAAGEGNIESLSFRAIKAGQNGLRKRQEGLSPSDAKDMQDYRIIKQVIEEADRIVKEAATDVQHTLQIIREGGKVSEQTMRQTISTLKDLKASVDENDADFLAWGKDLDFMEAKLKEFGEAQRRAKGEIVDANDARREMLKLTEDGAKAAAKEREEAEQLIENYKKEGQALAEKRAEIQQNIDATRKEMDEQQDLIEKTHRRMEAEENIFEEQQAARKGTLDSLKNIAQKEREAADEKKSIAEEQIETEKYWQHQVTETGNKITDIKTKLEELRQQKLKPEVDTSEIERLNEELKTAQSLLDQKTAAANTAFNNYLDTRGLTPLSKRDPWKSQEEFIKQFGLGDPSDISYRRSVGKFQLPFDMSKMDVEDAAGDRYIDWEVGKEQAQQILADYNWFDEKIKLVVDKIHEQYEKLRQAFSEGVDPEQLKAVANNIKRLEDIKAKMMQVAESFNSDSDYNLGAGDSFRKQFGDIDGEMKKVETNVSRAVKKAIDERYEFHDKKHAVEIQEAKEASELADKEKEAAQAAVDAIKKEIEAKQQNVGATKSEAEALKELEDAQRTLNRNRDELKKYEGWLQGNLDALKQLGLTEEDLADEAKVREATEKNVLEILEAQANVGKEVAEQQRKLTGEVKMSQLGGTKAEQELYAKNKSLYNLEDYDNIDDAMERIAHLEMVSKLRNGKKFSDETSWDPDDELDEDEAITMTDKERQYAQEELRVLKQHVREKILKAIHEIGDVDKAIKEVTGGGDGVSEDSKFGEQLNDKIAAIKEKISENIKTTVESYNEILDEEIDREIPLTKEELTSRIKGTISSINEEIGRDRQSIEWAKQDVQEYEAIVEAKQKQADAIKAGAQAQADANAKSAEEARLESELATAEESHSKAKERLNQETEKSNRLNTESAEVNTKAEEAENRVADAQSELTRKQDEFNQKQEEGMKTINDLGQSYDGLKTKLQGQEQALEANSQAAAENARNTADAQQRKQQAQELSIKNMEEMLTLLKQEYYQEGVNAEQHEKHAKTIQQLEKVIAEEKGKATLQMMTERMDDLGKLSNSAFEETKRFWQAMEHGADKGSAKLEQAKNNVAALIEEERRRTEEGMKEVLDKAQKGEYDTASMAVLDDAIKKLKAYQALINDPNGMGAETFGTTKDQIDALSAKLNTLKGVAEKVTGTFASADEVLQRFGEHMNAGKTASESMTQTLDEKLAGKTSSWDERIKEVTEYLETLKSDLEEYEEMFKEELEELSQLEQKHSKHGWLWKKTHAREYRSEERHIQWLREDTETGHFFDEDGNVKRTTGKGIIDDMHGYIQGAQEKLDFYKQKKAEELGLTEEETAAEEKKADAKRLTNEEMREGIKLLEEEYAKTDHTTEEGIKRRTELRSAIDQMTQEIKESTGEWMSYGEAEEFASKAGGDGFIATTEQMQKATQAMERHRDSLIKTIQLKQKNGEATDKEEKELKDLEEQLKRLKFENDNFNMTHKRMKELLDEPTQASDLDELRSAIKRADGELRHMQQSLGENSKQYQDFAEKVKNSKNVLKEMEGQAKANASAWDKAWSRLKTYVGMYMGFNMAWQRITGTADDLMQLSDKLGEVRKTTGFTADEVGRLSDSLKKMDTRTSITGLLDLSVAAGQLGLKSQQDVEGFTEAANKLMVALPEMGQEGATQMLKIALATGEISKIQRDMDAGLIDGSSATAVAMEKVGSTIDRLRASSAATAPAITDFVKRVGAVGAQSGISIDQVAALGSTVDALGMRVEMSATALSRMIPAIKNNAFAVAKAIGMVPEDLRAMFDEAGGGMNAMIAIFEHIKKQGMGADDIEKLLGMGGMQEIMKELNQQGARAGIVFAGLSQNVETLKAHLLTAAEAYKENTAIQQEYNKMNETTAAKWARLKNQLEEAFVSDSMQRGVGKLIDGLRVIIDLLTGDGGLSTIARGALVYLALFKSKWSEAIGNAILSLGKFIWSMRESAIAAEVDAAAKAADATATEALGDATEDTTEKTNIFTKTWGKMNAALKANIIGAAVTTIVWLASSLWDAHKAAKEAAEAINRVNEKTEEEREAVNSLFAPLKKANLEEAEKKRLITEINSKYGSYLNNMLTEASNAYEIERAYKAINLQLERKNTLEGIETNKKTVMERHKGALDTAYSEMDTAVSKAFFGKKGTDAARVSSLVSTAVRDAIKNGLSADQMSRQIQTALRKEVSAGRMKEYIQIMTGGTSRREDASKYIANAAIRYFNAEQAAQNEVKSTNKRLQNNLDYTIQEIRKAATKDIPELLKTFNNAMSKGTDAKKYSAKESNAVVQAFNAIKGYYDLHQADLTDAQRKKLSKALGTDITTFQSRAEGGGNNNGWGSNHEAASTDWRSMTAEELVARRKQMKDFVNAIQDDSDVERVLKEDAALQKAIAGGLNKNFRSVVEWYNTERLKIQDELYNRHLTNTGDWRDPKKGGGSWRRQLQTDFDTYLRILDAYYTERKAEIEKAQSEEGMSEAEAQRLIIENEIVWRKHRMELQQIYQGKSEQIAKEERQRIYDILAQQDEDTADMVEKTIGKSLGKMKILATKSEVDFNRVMSRITKSIAADFYKQQHAVSNQVEAIEKIIAQERPFDGLVENLEKNLSTMGILFAELDKKRREIIAAGNEPEDDTHLRGEDATRKRMLVLMQQAESAYTLTFGKLKEVMIKEGFADWAETIENDDQLRKAMMAMLRKMYDDVHAAIKKESTQMKKELDIWWNDIEGDGKLSRKGGFEKMLSDLGLAEDQVKRANSLIGAGQASERVADKLAIQQMRVRLAMQNAYYAKLKEIGELRIKQLQADEADLRKKGKAEEADLKLLDIKHAKQALNLSLSEEQTKVLEQEVAIQNQIEESQNRLYTELKAWGDLFASSIQSLMEASNAGNAEYYNELAKLNLTGKGGPGAGTYIVIDNEGTEDARAHYEYLDEREALERQREIEQQNAQAEAWKKVMDDINQKMNEQITDWINASMQNYSIDMNTGAVDANTKAIKGLTEELQGINTNTGNTGNVITGSEDAYKQGGNGRTVNGGNMGTDENGVPNALKQPEDASQQEGYGVDWKQSSQPEQSTWAPPMTLPESDIETVTQPWKAMADASGDATKKVMSNNNKIQAGTQSMFAKMTQAANLYGTAYQVMSNQNLSTSQKVQLMAVQAAGNAAISALTATFAETTADTAARTPSVFAWLWSKLGWGAIPVFALFTGGLGALMATATSAITKSKSQIAQATGASVSQGRLATGMQTYAEGNVNEFTDPASLTPGRHYNVDGADGKTYRAKYTGANPSTHLTNGPEFHLAGEKGREMIIDAGTTRQITMNETEIWHAIRTLSGGGRIAGRRGARRGMAAFAEGNVGEFEGMESGQLTGDGGSMLTPEMMTQFQASLDRSNELWGQIVTQGIKAIVSPYGPDGIVAGYDKYKKEALRHDVRHE